MTQQEFVLADWVGRLKACLDDLLSYEREVEYALSDLQWRAERALGLSGNTHPDLTLRIRERVGWYSMALRGSPAHDSTYRRDVSARLIGIEGMLLEHPTLRRAMYTSDDELVFGLDLAIERVKEQRVVWMVMGLVDYAVEHTSEAAAEALARMLQSGENQDLTSYSMVLFSGLHVEVKHDVAPGLSVIPWQEARQFMSDMIVSSLLGRSNRIDAAPIGAVVSTVKWGPAIVQQDFDFEANWTAEPDSFRDDALLLIDLIAVSQGSAVRSTGMQYSGVDQQVRRLVGRHPTFRAFPGMDDISKVSVPTNPELSVEKFSQATRLFAKMRGKEGGLRSALMRLASSQSREEPNAAEDRIVDVGIALELMFQAGSKVSHRIGERASCFLSKDRDDRLAICQTIKAFYDFRSDIVHGRLNGEIEAEDVFEGGFDIAQRTLEKLVLEGGPSTSRDWRKLVKSGGEK